MSSYTYIFCLFVVLNASCNDLQSCIGAYLKNYKQTHDRLEYLSSILLMVIHDW